MLMGKKKSKLSRVMGAQQETSYQLELINKWGNKGTVYEQGRIHLTNHPKILSVLDKNIR